MLLVGLHQPRGFVPVVELVGRPIGIPGFAEHEDVVAEAEGVGVHGHGPDVDIGVAAGGLAGGGAVEVPFGELVDGFHGAFDGLGG